MGKSQQSAAERAETLEGMSAEEKKLYRSRKTFVYVRHDWKKYFDMAKPAAAQEMIKAIIQYDETGEQPKFSDDMQSMMFESFFKPEIEKNFNEWCLSCHTNRVNGSLGGKARAANMAVVEAYQKQYKATEYNGVAIADIVSNESEAVSRLRENGCSDPEIDTLLKRINSIKAITKI